MKERKLNNKGFSLVELIIVIAIMVILVVVIAPQYTKFVNNSKIAADVQTAQAMATALDVAVADNKKPFGSDSTTTYANAYSEVNTTTATSKLGGTWTITGDDVNGVKKITLGIGSTTYECYPNPDVSGSDPGVNTLKK